MFESDVSFGLYPQNAFDARVDRLHAISRRVLFYCFANMDDRGTAT